MTYTPAIGLIPATKKSHSLTPCLALLARPSGVPPCAQPGFRVPAPGALNLPCASGFVIRTGNHSLLASGLGSRIYVSNRDSTKMTRLTNVRDVRKADGKWETLILLNGDQTKHNGCLQLRGRTENIPCGDIPAPLTDISYSRITWEKNKNRFILPGIYLADLYTIEAK